MTDTTTPTNTTGAAEVQCRHSHATNLKQPSPNAQHAYDGNLYYDPLKIGDKSIEVIANSQMWCLDCKSFYTEEPIDTGGGPSWIDIESAPKEQDILMIWPDGHVQVVWLKNGPVLWYETEPIGWLPISVLPVPAHSRQPTNVKGGPDAG